MDSRQFEKGDREGGQEIGDEKIPHQIFPFSCGRDAQGDSETQGGPESQGQGGETRRTF